MNMMMQALVNILLADLVVLSIPVSGIVWSEFTRRLRAK